MATQLDHLYGRSVTGMKADDEGWSITFEGDAILRNNDPSVTAPAEDIKGTVLMGSSDDTDPLLSFGYSGSQGSQIITEITLTEGNYEIMAPGDTEDEEVELPEDPSPDRVADGPDPDWKPEGTPDEAQEEDSEPS
jgi:hypothetical protein